MTITKRIGLKQLGKPLDSANLKISHSDEKDDSVLDHCKRSGIYEDFLGNQLQIDFI